MSGRIGYTSFQALQFFNLDFTFDLCITSSLDALQRLILQYITPLYIIILLAIVLLLTKVKYISKYMGQHSFLHGMWLIILISYLNIANSSFELLHCQFIGPSSDQQLVLVYDASVRCWTGAHLIWAVLAVSVVVIFILPFPVYVWIAIKIPKLKPLTDVYTSVYRSGYCLRYWPSYNLVRRLLIVIGGVFLTNFIIRHYILLLVYLFSLLWYILSWPYRSAIDNHFGAFVSLALVLFTVVTDTQLYTITDPFRVVSWLIFSFVIGISSALILLEIVLTLYSRRKKRSCLTKEEFFVDVVKPRIQRWMTKCACKIWKKRKVNSFELEDSTTAVITKSIYRTGTFVSVNSYREPLLDSDTLPQREILEPIDETSVDLVLNESSAKSVTYSEI